MLSPPLPSTNIGESVPLRMNPFFATLSAGGTVIFLLILLTYLTSDPTAVSGVLIATLTVALGLGFVTYSRGAIHPLSLIALVSYCQIALYIARPSYAIFFQESENLFNGDRYGAAYLQGQLIAAAGFIAICAGWVCVRPPNQIITHRDIGPYDARSWSSARLAVITVVILGFGLYSVYVLQIGPNRYFQGLLSGRSEMSRSFIEGTSAYLYSGLQFAFGALVLMHLQAGLTRERRTTVISAVLLVLAVVPNLSSGSRSIFIPIAVALLYIAFLVHPSILRMSRVVVWAPISYVLLLIAPRLWREQLATGGSLGESVTDAFTPEALFGDFFGGLDTAMLDAFAVQIAAQASGTIPLHWGGTYLTLFSSFIPRQIWADKPASVDQILNAELFPYTYAQGTGFSFGFYSEPYLNFGWVGVLVVGIFFGAVLGRISRWVRSSGTVFPAFIVIMVSSYIFPLMRGSLSFDLQRLLIPLIPLLIFLVFFRLLSPPNNLQEVREWNKPQENLQRRRSDGGRDGKLL